MRLTLTAAALMAAGIAVYANDSIPQRSVTLNEVTVSARRHSAGDVYGSLPVFSISSDRIAFNNPMSAADILTTDGRLTVQKSQFGGGSPSIRGFESSRVLLVMDGIRMNNLIYRGGHLQNIITIDPAMIQNVDVIYGPSSVMYGSDALGGTIAFTTKNPELSSDDNVLFKGSAFTRYGTVNHENTWHLDFNIAGRKFASYTSLSMSRFGDLQAGRNSNPFMKDDSYVYRQYNVVHDAQGQDVLVPNDRPWNQIGSGYNQYDLLQKFLWRPSDDVKHLFNFQYSTSSDIGRYDRLTDMKKDKPKFAQWYYGPQTRFMGGYYLTLNNRLGADAASFVVAYQLVKESRHNRKLDEVWLGNRNERVNVVTLNTDWVKTFGRHTITAGIDGSLQFLKSTADRVDVNTGAVKTLDTRYPDGNNYMHNLDLFGIHRWQINERWHMNEGIRVGYSWMHSTFKSNEFFPFADLIGDISQNTPVYCANVGVTFAPSAGWLLGLDISTGYRVPNVDDLAKVFDSQPGMVVMPNPDIKPEKTVSANFSASFVKNDIVNWQASVYGTYMFDAIALAPAWFNGQDKIEYDGELSNIYCNRNNRLGYVVGASTNVDVRLSDHFRADGAVTYTYGNIIAHKGEERMPLDHVAPLFGRVGVSYHTLADRLTGEFYSLFNGKKPLSRYNLNGEDNIGYATVKGLDGDGLPAWFTLNFRVSYRLNRYVTVQGAVENILDTEYRTFASGINAPGRNFSITLRASF